MISFNAPNHLTINSSTLTQESNQSRKNCVNPTIISKPIINRRLLVSTFVIIPSTIFLPLFANSKTSKTTSTNLSDAISKFNELPNSGGVKALDLRLGVGSSPIDGDQVAIHYYGRLAAKQGWRFDSTYEHKDSTGEPIPFIFILGSSNVISGIEAAVRTMREGGIRRVIIPPSQGYQTTTQEPLPPNYFDRQRLFTTIFNPTRLANGEGSTLGTLIFDIELVKVKH